MVKRYDPVIHPMDNGGMEECHDGSFVRLSDYNRAVDAIRNFLALMDCPVGRRVYDSEYERECVKFARKVLGN